VKDRKATVIGVGMIGGSLCGALRKRGVTVRGVSSPRTIQKAESLGIIDAGYEWKKMEDAVDGSDFVFICTPLSDIGKRIPPLLETAGKNTVITDVGSTKTNICRIAREHKRNGVYFIGGHPMAGKEKRGVENADPYLFYDAAYVLTPLPGTPRKVTRTLSSLLASMGANIMILDPELHDRIAASVSHLPQLLAVLLTNHVAGKDSDVFRNLAAGGFRDMTRIASSSFDLWKDIIETNRSPIVEALDDFSSSLQRLTRGIDDEDFLRESFHTAHRERQTIPRYGKGFLTPLVDIRVSVRDRPGELARITNIIFYNDINIKDIEIVTVREGEGGVLRLGFSEKEDALRSAEILTGIGYEVSVVE